VAAGGTFSSFNALTSNNITFNGSTTFTINITGYYLIRYIVSPNIQGPPTGPFYCTVGLTGGSIPLFSNQIFSFDIASEENTLMLTNQLISLLNTGDSFTLKNFGTNTINRAIGAPFTTASVMFLKLSDP
jgi:hypothetical protein